jgi:NTP pyrophosphatase (non-canonical NTP hydrolase)
MEKVVYGEATKPAVEPIGMLLTEYQAAAMSYRLPSANAAYSLLNLAGEVGELFSLCAKGIRDGVADKDAHRRNIGKELGDVLWHVAAVAADHGYTLDELAAMNLNKLKDRAERGKISGSGDDR